VARLVPQPETPARAEPWARVVIGKPGPAIEPAPPKGYGPGLAWCPDTECDGWSTAQLTLRSASVRGDGHRYYRQPRQDATVAVVHDATGAVLFAVADGVSAATHGQTGASVACQAAVHSMSAMLDSGLPLDVGAVARRAARDLRHHAASLLGVPAVEPAQAERLLATTLVAGAARPDPDGIAVSLFRIGDSGAWLLDVPRGRYYPLFGSKADASAVIVSGEVSPLPRVPDPIEQASGQLTDGLVLLVATDGFGDPLGAGTGEVGQLFARALSAAPPPLRLAQLLDFSRETFDDDRTLLGLWPRGGGMR